MSVTLNGTSGLVFSDGTIQGTAAGNSFRNRIINGDMRIDQRNAGASISVTTGAAFYSVDRFRLSATASSGAFTGQQVSDGPQNFDKSLRITVTATDTSLSGTDSYYIVQNIEGNNVADLRFGNASASTVTLSFWVKSSLTGTFGGALSNSAVTRSYPFSYTISAANTWENKTVTISGDTTGAWATDNGTGIRVYFSLGVPTTYAGTAGAWAASQLISSTGAVSVIGTSGATFQLTGVQFEKAAAPTSFEHRSFGTELALCQRYYEKSFNLGTKPIQNVGTTSGTLLASNYNGSASAIVASTTFMVSKRAIPNTVTTYNPFAAGSGWSRSGSGDFAAGDYSTGDNSIGLRVDGATGTSSGNMSIHWAVDAEL
jgi:hypothetical protein